MASAIAGPIVGFDPGYDDPKAPQTEADRQRLLKARERREKKLRDRERQRQITAELKARNQ